MKHKATRTKRTTCLMPQELHDMEKGARIATEWALQDFKRLVEEAEVRAKAIVDSAKAIESKANRTKRKANDVLQRARNEYQLIIQDAENIAEDIIENAMQHADEIATQAMQQYVAIENNVIANSVIDLTTEVDDGE